MNSSVSWAEYFVPAMRGQVPNLLAVWAAGRFIGQQDGAAAGAEGLGQGEGQR